MYSQPSLMMKNPLKRCTVQIATTITPIIPAAANGVISPAANSRPAPTSVTTDSRAWSSGHFIPIDPNHRAVPARRPPRNAWLYPW